MASLAVARFQHVDESIDDIEQCADVIGRGRRERRSWDVEREAAAQREADLGARLSSMRDAVDTLESRIREHERREAEHAARASASRKPPTVSAIARRQLQILNGLAADGEVIFPAPLLNGQEQLVLRVARAWAAERDLLVSAQVGMAGFLRTSEADEEKLLRTYLAKRADFVIYRENGEVLLVVEHNGGGHYEEGAALRDKVKRRLLHLAGLGLLVTYEEWDEAKIRARLDQAMADPRAAIPQWPEKIRRPPAGVGRFRSRVLARGPEARP